jgi:hypothetical protein
VSDGTNAYTWDARNHLVSVAGPNSAAFVGACPERSRRNALRRGAAKTVNGTVPQFLGACPERSRRDGLNPVEELDGANPPNVTATMLAGLRIDEFFQRTDSNGAADLLIDALGSTLGLADSTGTVQTAYTYEPFGNVTVSGPSTNPYQFTGRENDGTGLYFYR